MEDQVHSQPSEISAEDGVVFVDGPNGLAISLTPEAAEETSERLLFGAMTAQAQRREKNERARR